MILHLLILLITTVESNAPAKNITDIDIMEVVNSKIASLSPSDLHPGGTYTVRYISSGSYELRYGGTSVSNDRYKSRRWNSYYFR